MRKFKSDQPESIPNRRTINHLFFYSTFDAAAAVVVFVASLSQWIPFIAVIIGLA